MDPREGCKSRKKKNTSREGWGRNTGCTAHLFLNLRGNMFHLPCTLVGTYKFLANFRKKRRLRRSLCTLLLWEKGCHSLQRGAHPPLCYSSGARLGAPLFQWLLLQSHGKSQHTIFQKLMVGSEEYGALWFLQLWFFNIFIKITSTRKRYWSQCRGRYWTQDSEPLHLPGSRRTPQSWVEISWWQSFQQARGYPQPPWTRNFNIGNIIPQFHAA